MVRAIVAPSVLSSDLSALSSEALKYLQAGADWLHLDIMDGHFVPNFTIGPPVVSCLRKAVGRDIFLDCHCMISEPWKWVNAFADAGANQFTFHIETTPTTESLRSLLGSIREARLHTGVALRPVTQVSEDLKEAVKEGLVDMVLIMTVDPGFGGQSFLPEPVEKVRTLRSLFPDLDIQVDGGITDQTAPVVCQAGANVLVSGSWLYKHQDWAEATSLLRSSIVT
mmetsp:Transcript_30118/g.53389  ORF Transcript_30118/g.53389 Transcript_30118/m.53389 type:complete len:225 (-) Transcript_30118:1161-1835(-)